MNICHAQPEPQRDVAVKLGENRKILQQCKKLLKQKKNHLGNAYGSLFIVNLHRNLSVLHLATVGGPGLSSFAGIQKTLVANRTMDHNHLPVEALVILLPPKVAGQCVNQCSEHHDSAHSAAEPTGGYLEEAATKYFQ